MRIMFMGTPDISAVCLERLINDGHPIVAVVTGEDKPRGRGNVMTPTPVKALASAHDIPVYTPKTLRDGAFDIELKKIAPDLILVVAYGKILPKSLLDYPRYGCVNAHVSLLPKYRGAAPMQRAIMNGDSETGVTLMFMNEGLDTGDIITSESFPIGRTDDFEAVHNRSAEISARLLSELCRTVEGGVTRTKQDDSLATYASKIEKEDCKIDFGKDSRVLDFMIRGVTPIPGAFAYLNGKMLKISNAEPVFGEGRPGEVIAIDSERDGSITVACGIGALKIKRVKPEGKGYMSAGDLIRGRKISLGDILE